jgi:hypothetical protein
MSLLLLIGILVILGIVAYFINLPSAPIQGTFKLLINWVLVIVAVIVILKAFGVWQWLGSVHV